MVSWVTSSLKRVGNMGCGMSVCASVCLCSFLLWQPVGVVVMACFSLGWCNRFIGLGLVCGCAELGLFVSWLVLRGDFSVALLGLVSGSGFWLGRVVLVFLSLG